MKPNNNPDPDPWDVWSILLLALALVAVGALILIAQANR